jgi:hypothetical protein
MTPEQFLVVVAVGVFVVIVVGLSIAWELWNRRKDK